MPITVSSLIDQFKQIPNEAITENEESNLNISLEGKSAKFEEVEKKVLAALNMGVIVEGVLNERRSIRNKRN